MKEDILEQITADYLNLYGYFTLTNVKFHPSKNELGYVSRQDSVNSDIDVIGFNPLKAAPEKVIAVSCKSWQGGFYAKKEMDAIETKK
jgi:hypothetical protein